MLLFLNHAVAEFHCHCNDLLQANVLKSMSFLKTFNLIIFQRVSTTREKHRKHGPLVHSRMSVRKTQQASATARLHALPVWLHGPETYFLQHTTTVQEVPHTFLIITPDAALHTVTMAGTQSSGGKDVFQRWGGEYCTSFPWVVQQRQPRARWDGWTREATSVQNAKKVQRFPAGQSPRVQRLRERRCIVLLSSLPHLYTPTICETD